MLLLAAAPGAVAGTANEPCLAVQGLNDRCPVWTGNYGSNAGVTDVGNDVLVTPDGATVVTLGITRTDASSTDWTIVANDASTGARKWLASRRGPGTQLDSPSGMAVGPDGTAVFVTGTTCTAATEPESCDLVLIALDVTSGAEVWQTVVDGTDYDSGAGIALSPDGATVYVAGVASSQATGGDAALLAFDSESGDLLWRSTYDGGVRGFDAAHRVAVSEDGERAFITGPSPGGATGNDFATIALDAATGERLWVARRDDHGGQDQPTAIAAGDGTVVITGTTDQGPGGLQADYVTVAYDEATGQALWTKTYNGGTLDLPLDLSMASDGGAVYVTGMSRGTTGGYDMATVAYATEDGNQAWAKRFNGLGNNGDAAWAVEASPDGEKVYIAGDTLLPGAVDYAHAVIAYDADDGEVLWTGLHRGGGPQGGTLPQGIDVSADGSRVYYAGQVLAATNDADFLTLAYDAG